MKIGEVLQIIDNPKVMVVFKTEEWFKENFEDIKNYFSDRIGKCFHGKNGGYIEVIGGPQFEFLTIDNVRGHKANYAITEGNFRGSTLNDDYIRGCCLLPPHYHSFDSTQNISDDDD